MKLERCFYEQGELGEGYTILNAFQEEVLFLSVRYLLRTHIKKLSLDAITGLRGLDSNL